MRVHFRRKRSSRSFYLKDIASLLGSIGADTVSPGGGGSDIGPIVADGVPSLSPRTVGEHYFDWHHTEADTLDKVDPDSFKKNTAMLSVGWLMCWLIWMESWRDGKGSFRE